MRGLAWFVTLLKTVVAVVALGGPLSVLPGIPAIPDGTDVKVVNSSAQAVYATGLVKSRVLTMTITAGKLPANEKVHLWIGIPLSAFSENRDVKNLAGTTSSNGTDILIGEGKERVSFTQLLKEAYGIRLELR